MSYVLDWRRRVSSDRLADVVKLSGQLDERRYRGPTVDELPTYTSGGGGGGGDRRLHRPTERVMACVQRRAGASDLPTRMAPRFDPRPGRACVSTENWESNPTMKVRVPFGSVIAVVRSCSWVALTHGLV